jgi:mannose/cellobiose epimerase-like protein (N-acyl-D-glucosamine 2-epimerase family)
MDCQLASLPARLWPQTERARAALRLAHARGPNRATFLNDALAAAGAIGRYLDMPRPGLWHDRMRPDGSFVEEPTPASGLYHIVGWIRELSIFKDHIIPPKALPPGAGAPPIGS